MPYTSILPLVVGRSYLLRNKLKMEVVRELKNGRFVGIVILENGTEEIYLYTTSGYALDSFLNECTKFEVEDIWREKKKRIVIGFANIYQNTSEVFDSYTEAMQKAGSAVIAKAIRFEHEVEFEVQG